MEILSMLQDSSSKIVKELVQFGQSPQDIKNTERLRNLMSKHPKTVCNWALNQRQRDLPDFLSNLFEILISEVQSIPNAETMIENTFTSKYILVYKCDSGGLMTGVECENFLKHMHEFPFMTLTVAGEHEVDFVSVETSIKNHDQFLPMQCKSCVHNDNLEKIDTLPTKIPSVLMIQLGLYDEYDEEKQEKKQHNINFETLLRPWGDQYASFVLIGASLHHGGSMLHGHYTTLLINPVTLVATEISDSQVRDVIRGEVNIQHALKNSYVLLYERKDAFDKRHLVQSPMKKRPKSMDVEPSDADRVRRNLGDFTGPQNAFDKNFLYNFLTGELWIDVQMIPSKDAMFYCRKLGLSEEECLSASDPRKKMEEYFLKVIWESELSESDKEDLSDRYNIKLKPPAAVKKQSVRNEDIAKRQQVEHDIVQGRAYLNFKELTDANVRWYLNILNFESGDSLEQQARKDKLRETLVNLIRVQVEDPDDQEELLKQYKIPTDVKKKKSPVQKMVLKMANTVKSLRIGSKTSLKSSNTDTEEEAFGTDTLPTSPQEIVKLLDMLQKDQVSRQELVRYTKDEKHDTIQLKNSLKGMLISSLIKSLTVAQIREILPNPDKTNKKLPGQIKAAAMKENNILQTIIDIVINGSAMDSPDLDTCTGIVEQLTKQLSGPEMKTLHRLLFNEDAPKKQNHAYINSKIRKKLVETLIAKLEKTKLEQILKTMHKDAVAPSKQKAKLKSIVVEKDFEKLTVFLDLVKGADPQPECGPAQQLKQRDTETTSEMEVEESLVQTASEIDDGISDNVSKMEARRYIDELRENLTKPALIEMYNRLGGKGKAVRSVAFYEEFIKRRCLAILLENLPHTGMYMLQTELDLPTSTKAALQRHAMQNHDTMDAIISLFDRAQVGILNDFHPLTREKITERQEEMIDLRKEQTETLFRESRFTISPDNPLLKEGIEIEKKCEELKMEHCVVCRETRFESNVDPDTGICARCTKTKPKNEDDVWLYGEDNEMYPGEQPDVLKDLTLIEQAAISRLHLQMRIIRYRGGGTALRGHSMLFRQDIPRFYKELPCNPEDLPIIILVPPHETRVPLEANRYIIKHALEWLQENNPHYADIEINESNLARYPIYSNTPVNGLSRIEVAETAEERRPETAAADDDHHGAEAEGELVETLINEEAPVEMTRQRVRSAMNIGTLGENAVPDPIPWAPRIPGRVSEFERNGLMSQMCPHLFPWGKGDYFLTRQKDVKLLDYVQHLIWLDIPGEKENRFAKDQRFLFFCVNMFGRHQSLMLSNVYTSNIIKDLTLEQVKEALQDPNSNLSQCMVHMSAQIPGTNGYFAHSRKLVKATEEWIRIASYGVERFNTFLTFSLPDSHMEQLHKFLPGSETYLGKTPVDDMAGKDDDLFIDKKDDYQLRQTAVQNNLHIVDEFVHIKLDLLKNKILKPYLGMVDYVIRAEFQSRTAIHFHIIGRCINAPALEDMEIAFKKYLFVEEFRADCVKFGMSEDEIRREIFKEKMAGYVIVEPSEAMEVRDTVFPAREKTVQFAKNMLGLSALHPEMDSDQWPPKYGYNLNPPSSNALRTSLKSVPNDEQSLVQDYAELVTRVELHTCRKGYCKKDIPHPVYPHPHTILGPCRFGFDKEKQGFKTVPKLDADGQEIPGRNDYVLTDDVREQYPDGARIVSSTLDLMRNHPQLVEHIPEFLSIWRGNIDCKLIKNVATLIEYVCKYVTKPESSSMRYNEIMQEIAKATENDQTRGNLKRLITKIFMTFVKEHDMGKPEAIKIISQRPFVDYSRPVVYVNCTDKRRVNVELYQAGVTEAPALNKNHADKYWLREESDDYHRALERYEEDPLSMLNPKTVNLYTFAGLFDKNWMYTGIWKVPVPSPLFTRWPNKAKLPEPYKECCRVKLLLFKPGVNPTNILWKNLENEDDGEFESLEAAMLDFATDEYSQCPKHTAKQFLKQYDPPEEELLFGGELDDIDDVADQLIQAQGDPEEEGELLPGLGPIEMNLLNDANDDALMDMMFAEEMDEDEDLELQHDQQHNWHADRERLGLTDAKIKEGKHWIDDQKKDPTVVLQVAERHYEVENLNPVQRKVYEKAMQAIDNPDEQVLIDVCGSAGTGKSYTINTILQHAEAGSVQILAPTGAAACQFVGGKTLHSFLKLNVSKARSQRGQERGFKSLTEAQAQSLEKNLEDVKLLIIDEKGMVGLGRLYQIGRRLQEGRPHKRDQPFGGMSILLAGDLRQLQPVCDVPLYGELTNSNRTEVTSTGQQLYRMFDTETYKLEQQMRQRGAENEEFRKELDSLGDLGKLPSERGNKDAYKRWQSKMDYYKMSGERRADFDKNATLIAMKKEDLKDFNKRHVLALGNPICLAKAENKPEAAKTYKDDEADGLMNQLALAHEAKFVLTRNLWQEAGLVNGAICFVHSVIFKEGADTTGDRLPDMLLLQFPSYTGPSYLPDEEKIVPIYPIQATWHTRDKDEMARTQFPLIPGYAITVHKAQGDC